MKITPRDEIPINNLKRYKYDILYSWSLFDLVIRKTFSIALNKIFIECAKNLEPFYTYCDNDEEADRYINGVITKLETEYLKEKENDKQTRTS